MSYICPKPGRAHARQCNRTLMMMKRISALVLSILLGGTLYAQEAVLPLSDAKAMAMGGLSTTLLAGSHTVYTNAASAAFAAAPAQLSSTYLTREGDDFYAVSGYWRFGQLHAAQLGWRQYLRGGDNSDMALDLGYSLRINERWAIGLVGRYLHLQRPETDFDALSVDLSMLYALPLENLGNYSTLRVGGKLGNLGGYFNRSGELLPMNATAGVALDTYISDAHEITVGTDLGYCFTPGRFRGFELAAGAEYNLMQLFQLRAGYHYGENRYFSPSYASVGAGVRFMHLRLDFAYLFAASDSPVSDTYCISFGLDF